MKPTFLFGISLIVLMSCEKTNSDLTGVYQGVYTVDYSGCGSLDAESETTNGQMVVTPTGNGNWFTDVANVQGEQSSFEFPDICGNGDGIVLDSKGNFNSTCDVAGETFTTKASIKRGVLKIEVTRGIAPACVRKYTFEGSL